METRGFTLIEVTLGLLILAIGLLAVGGMQILSIKGNAFSKNLTEAAILAQDRFEGLRSLPFDHPDLASASRIEIPCSGSIFTRHYSVAQSPLYPDSKNITVAVSWKDTSDHRLTFTTVISR
jgi:prepilin-type N-terminal cleavage/methylation domain-containing protein